MNAIPETIDHFLELLERKDDKIACLDSQYGEDRATIETLQDHAKTMERDVAIHTKMIADKNAEINRLGKQIMKLIEDHEKEIKAGEKEIRKLKRELNLYKPEIVKTPPKKPKAGGK